VDVFGFIKCKARKAHVCWWCGEAIERGSRYATWACVDSGILRVKVHLECHAAWNDLEYFDNEVVGFGEFARGCCCAAGQCKCGSNQKGEE
jgi:hypothetical protein